MKTLHGLLHTDVEQLTNVREVERLASWALRYSMVFPLLRPVSGALYRDIVGRVRGHQQFHLSEASKQVVFLWRAALISMSVHGRKTARLLTSVVKGRVIPEFLVRFDGWV